MPYHPAMRPASTLLLILTLATGLHGAAPRATDEILSAVQARLEDGGSMDELIAELDNLKLAELKLVRIDVDKAWDQLKGAYLSAFASEAKSQHSGEFRQENARLIRTSREEFHRVRGMAEDPMKPLLKSVSRPAIDQLRELLLPDPQRILDVAGPALKQQREMVMRLATFRQGVLAAVVASGETDAAQEIRDGESAVANELSGLPRDGLRIMADNAKIAAKAEIPENERIGIEDLNLMRLLVGQNALRIDPKLCEAARGHSEDMKTLGFFAHESPVPGKKSPSDRAAKAGTSGGGENIYVGSTSPLAANQGWFYSPGHHKNMFSPGYGRVGLGNHGTHWTQMFGR